MWIENPSVFGPGKILQSGRRVNTHGRDGSLDAIRVLLEVIERSITLAHPEHPDAAAWTRQLARLDQPIQCGRGADDRCDTGGVIVGALFEQVPKRQHLL